MLVLDISCQQLGDGCKLECFCVPFRHRVGKCTFLENVYCGVVDVRCGGCLVWWMSGVVDVWCGGCPVLLIVWWMSGVVVVWCGGCPISPMVWWMSGVVDVWCGGCLCGGCFTINIFVLDIFCQHLGGMCELNMYVGIGYIMPTIGGWM